MSRKLIRISTSVRKEIMERFGCQYATLKDAMEYITDTALSRELRRKALELGGEVWVPERDALSMTAERMEAEQ